MFKIPGNRPFLRNALVYLPIVILCLILMRVTEPPGPASPDYNGFSSFIIAFEFVTSHQGVHTLFSNFDRSSLGAMRIPIYIDFGFLLGYSIFLVGVFRIARKITHSRLFIFPLVMAVLAGIADALENLQLLELLDIYLGNMPARLYPEPLELLWRFTWLKWIMLSISSVFFFFFLVYRGHWLRFPAIVLMAPGLLLAIIAVSSFSPQLIELFTFSVFVNVGLIFIFSLVHRRLRPA